MKFKLVLKKMALLRKYMFIRATYVNQRIHQEPCLDCNTKISLALEMVLQVLVAAVKSVS